jgi:hypothetical protein
MWVRSPLSTHADMPQPAEGLVLETRCCRFDSYCRRKLSLQISKNLAEVNDPTPEGGGISR